MLIDKENELSDSQAVTATAISEHVIDLGVTPPENVNDIAEVPDNITLLVRLPLGVKEIELVPVKLNTLKERLPERANDLV